jgi:hypothetical protein
MNPFGNGSGGLKGGGAVSTDLITNPGGKRAGGAAGPLDTLTQANPGTGGGGGGRPPTDTAAGATKPFTPGGVGSVGNPAKPYR